MYLFELNWMMSERWWRIRAIYRTDLSSPIKHNHNCHNDNQWRTTFSRIIQKQHSQLTNEFESLKLVFLINIVNGLQHLYFRFSLLCVPLVLFSVKCSFDLCGWCLRRGFVTIPTHKNLSQSYNDFHLDFSWTNGKDAWTARVGDRKRIIFGFGLTNQISRRKIAWIRCSWTQKCPNYEPNYRPFRNRFRSLLQTPLCEGLITLRFH